MAAVSPFPDFAHFICRYVYACSRLIPLKLRIMWQYSSAFLRGEMRCFLSLIQPERVT